MKGELNAITSSLFADVAPTKKSLSRAESVKTFDLDKFDRMNELRLQKLKGFQSIQR